MAQQRRDKGEGALFKRGDLWVGVIELPPGPDGKRRRKQVTSKDKTVARDKLEKAKADLRLGLDPNGDKVTVAAWFEHWVNEIAPHHAKPNTVVNYRTAVTKYIAPTIGAVRMKEVRPSHLRLVHQAVKDAGRSSGTALNIHWTLSSGFQAAVYETLIERNPCEAVKPPKATRSERGALTVEQAKVLLSTSIAAGDPMATRWAAALMLGGRQGELLGLTWDRCDLERGTLDLAWALDRLPVSHGCGDTCGWKWASRCEQVVFDVPDWFTYKPLYRNLALVEPKTEQSKRLIPIPAPLLAMLRHHKESSPRNEFDLVWASSEGFPVEPAKDLAAWKVAIARAGLPSVVLHEARHTTATLLLELGVPTEVIMALLGHSTVLVTRSYQHGGIELSRAAVDQLSEQVMPALE